MVFCTRFPLSDGDVDPCESSASPSVELGVPDSLTMFVLSGLSDVDQKANPCELLAVWLAWHWNAKSWKQQKAWTKDKHCQSMADMLHQIYPVCLPLQEWMLGCTTESKNKHVWHISITCIHFVWQRFISIVWHEKKWLPGSSSLTPINLDQTNLTQVKATRMTKPTLGQCIIFPWMSKRQQSIINQSINQSINLSINQSISEIKEISWQAMQTMLNHKTKHIQESDDFRERNICWYDIWLNTTLSGMLLRNWDSKGTQYFFV